jgi:hypothetical protein
VLALVVIGVFIVVLVGRSRGRKAKALAADMSPQTTPSNVPAEPSDSAGAPSATTQSEAPTAELLSPISAGEWQSPPEPAPAAELPELSLAERTRRFEALIPEVLPRQSATPLPSIPMAGPVLPVAAPASPTSTDEPTRATQSAPEPEPAWSPPLADPVEPPPTTTPAPPDAPDGHGSPDRPRAHARPLPDPSIAPVTPSTLVWPDEPASPPSRPAQFVDMVAPVEMWFGDYRVGVKSGSKTHAQFRKYADVLLRDLKGESERAR